MIFQIYGLLHVLMVLAFYHSANHMQDNIIVISRICNEAGGGPGDTHKTTFLRFNGADGRNRTADLLITNQLLYRLSYIGRKPAIIDPEPFSGLVFRTLVFRIQWYSPTLS